MTTGRINQISIPSFLKAHTSTLWAGWLGKSPGPDSPIPILPGDRHGRPTKKPGFLESSTLVLLTRRSVCLLLLVMAMAKQGRATTKRVKKPNQFSTVKRSRLSCLALMPISEKESPPSLPSHIHSHKRPKTCLSFSCQSKRQPPFQVFSHKTSLSTRIATHTQQVLNNIACPCPCQQIRLADKTIVNHHRAPCRDNPGDFHGSLSKKSMTRSSLSPERDRQEPPVSVFQPKAARFTRLPLTNVSYQESNTHLKPSFGLAPVW